MSSDVKKRDIIIRPRGCGHKENHLNCRECHLHQIRQIMEQCRTSLIEMRLASIYDETKHIGKEAFKLQQMIEALQIANDDYYPWVKS